MREQRRGAAIGGDVERSVVEDVIVADHRLAVGIPRRAPSENFADQHGSTLFAMNRYNEATARFSSRRGAPISTPASWRDEDGRMGFRVEVQGLGAGFEVAEGETILDAALREGLGYPFGCQSGNCGACKSVLLAGEVELNPYSEFALTDAERAQSLILGCRAMPQSDCEVALLDAEDIEIHASRELVCRVVALDDVTHDIKRMRLEIESGGPYAFSAGQFASLRFEGLPPRDYSMANRPDEAMLEFHIRLVAGGAVTPFVRESLKPGDSLRVSGPLGTSYWRRKHTGPIFALAGGSGLAPIKSIIETALAAGVRQPIRLYFGVRGDRDLYLEEHFNALAAQHTNFSFVPVLSEPSGATTRRTGFLADVIRADAPALDGAKAYLAGPPVMVESCVAALIALGMRKSDCHADAFYTEADKQKLAARKSA
jgi:CDP-4-dehydro-6-deoxyglucose reductase/ferredoxin-NAD(P)+ reductase (naphthalene dioxygenase ferredoxin-specific)